MSIGLAFGGGPQCPDFCWTWAFPVCPPRCWWSPRLEASAGTSPATLLTHRCRRSPRSTGCWAQSCTARACRPWRAKGKEHPAEPLLDNTLPKHTAGPRASLTGTKLSLRRRTMSPTQMSHHFCQRKLKENLGENMDIADLEAVLYLHGTLGTWIIARQILFLPSGPACLPQLLA